MTFVYISIFDMTKEVILKLKLIFPYSQKCVRVGGKLCDLDQVGHDGHHHTFFEMLGSWAFNNTYGRAQSIQLAWKLLTEGYGLSKDRLYVTYFGGCQRLGLPADTATKEEWLALGLDPAHVIPFGSADNFWQMGLEGPCGPCTEIHYSRHKEKGAGQHLVNMPNQDDVQGFPTNFKENLIFHRKS